LAVTLADWGFRLRIYVKTQGAATEQGIEQLNDYPMYIGEAPPSIIREPAAEGLLARLVSLQSLCSLVYEA
jgi:hypothetical protein